MERGLRLDGRVIIPDEELTEHFMHSSGPGGQGVNTADTKVALSFDLARSPSVPADLRRRMLTRLRARTVAGVITVVASQHRTQLANRRAARERLARLLREAAAPPPRRRRATRPTRGAIERRLAAKKRRAEVKRGRGRYLP